MSSYDQDRRRPEKRQAVSDFKNAKEARTFSGVSANNPVPIETTSFSNAESEVGCMSTRNMAIQQQQQQQLYIGCQPRPRGEMMQRSQGMRERDHMNQNIPVAPTGYSSCPPGMHLMHPPVHYEQPPGVRMINQPTPQLTMHSMAQQQEQQECQYPQQPDGWQPQSGSEMIQNPQEVIERDHMNQNVPVAPTGYSSCPPGMRLMHPPVHYEQPPGACMINQPTPQLTMHNMTQQQEQQECQYPQQPDRWQPQSGGENMQRSQGMRQWNYVNCGMPRGVPQPDPTGYPGFQPVMQPPAHYGPHSGMGMPRMINQPTPQPAMYNMAQSGGPMMQRHPHMGTHPGMVRPPMNPSPFMTWEMQPGTTIMQISGEHCQMMTRPYTSVVSSLHHPPSHLPVVSHFLSGTPSTFFYEMFQTPQRNIGDPQSTSVSHVVIPDKPEMIPHKRNRCNEPSKRPINPLQSLSLSSASLVNSETVIVSPNDSSAGFVYNSVDLLMSSEHKRERKKAVEEEHIAQCKITSNAFKNVSLVMISSDNRHSVITTQESLVRQGHLYFKDHSRKQSKEIACCSDTINQQSWKKGWADGWMDGWMDASKGLPLNPEIPFNYKKLLPELTRPSSLPNYQLTNMFSQNILTQSVQEGNVTATYQSIGKIFQIHSADLCDAIEADPLRIVNRLTSFQLIAPNIKKDITNMNGGAYEKANKIVLSIEKHLKASSDPVEYMQKFCDFLQNKVEDGILNNIGAKMRSDLHIYISLPLSSVEKRVWN